MITNKDRYPEAKWLSDEQIRQVGTIGGMPLVLVGFDVTGEADQKMPLVSRSYASDPTSEELFASPLEEMLKSQEEIAITEDLTAS